ncbi:MAG TPA: response regulator [Planctomycetota bacterium]|nr:response regulator [Planctomycetota bacterium]
MDAVKNLVLLVEDSPDDAELTELAFRMNGIAAELIVARDGVEALEYLHAAGRRTRLPSVILLDLKLPRVDGLEVLRRLRSDERTRSVPIVVLSSSSEESDVLLSYEFGANSYIRKPVDFAQFSETARQLAGAWLTGGRR